MSRISKGKLHHLWSLYDVWDLLVFRENDRKAALRRPVAEFRGTASICRRKLHSTVPDPKFHLGIKDTAGHTLTLETYDNGVTASVVRNAEGKVLAYDFEADIHSDWIVKLDPKDLENYKGRVLRPDGLPDMDVAETYPHKMEVFDEENFDRIIAEMGAQRMLRLMIPIHEQQRLDIVDDPNALVELVDGIWRRKGQYPHETLVGKRDGSFETFDPNKATLWGTNSSGLATRIVQHRHDSKFDEGLTREVATRGYYEGGRDARRMGKPGPDLSIGELFLREMFTTQCATADEPPAVS